MGSMYFFKECCFMVRVRIRVRLGVRFSVNPNPKTAYFKKKSLDPDSDPGPDRPFCSHTFKRVLGFVIEYA